MSEVRVNNIVDYGGKGAPTFDNGAVISGVSSLGNQAKIGSNVTITSGGINVSGVTTAATLSGNLTGDVNSGFVTATSAVIGSGVTINAGGLNITGVCTATTFEGSGASMTGVAMTITPLAYNPDVNDSIVTFGTGIGITFDHRILAGSGNITLSVATNAGAAGTVVENFGVGSSVTIAGRSASIDPTNDLDSSETYHINYPSGCFTNTSGDVSYVGTAYTFGVKTAQTQLWIWGKNNNGNFGINNTTHYSSPVQLPGTDWTNMSTGYYSWSLFAKTDGTLWAAGYNAQGNLGLNNRTYYSSPVQIPGTTWDVNNFYTMAQTGLARKTDGTLWVWGRNDRGTLGLNQANNTRYSSPVQIPGTNWASIGQGSYISGSAIKTDGTLWSWGYNAYGMLGLNHNNNVSSPTQIPGTNWASVKMGYYNTYAWKTDGTLWVWGENGTGYLGLNNRTRYSSPVQIPGTNWTPGIFSESTGSVAIKTDGTLWTMGSGLYGVTGQNNTTYYSSPVQIPGTNWKDAKASATNIQGIKTDGTLWAWGTNMDYGLLGLNQAIPVKLSSPTQIGTDTDWHHLKENSVSQVKAAFKRF